MRHAWVQLTYDPRLAVGQTPRYMAVCCHCALEKDWASRSMSWVVGYRLRGGARYGQTSSYLPTPGCLGRLPTPDEVAEWNESVAAVSMNHPSQATGYNYGD